MLQMGRKYFPLKVLIELMSSAHIIESKLLYSKSTDDKQQIIYRMPLQEQLDYSL